MNTFSWIFLGLFIIDFILHMVFWFKKFQLAAELTGAAAIAFSGFFIICILINSLPDSWHIITFASIAVFLFTLSNLFKVFAKTNNLLRSISVFCFTASCYVWTALFHSVFYLVKVSAGVKISGIVIFAAIFTVLAVYSGKQKFSKYVLLMIKLSGPAFITFCGAVCISAYPALYSAAVLAGGVILLADLIFIILNTKTELIKNQTLAILFKTTLPAVAELLITAGSLIMIL